MKCILNTGRTVPQGAAVEHKGSDAYRAVASACFLNPVDMMVLGIENGARVRITYPYRLCRTERPFSRGSNPGRDFCDDWSVCQPYHLIRNPWHRHARL